jgi:hypothetical protein
MTFGRKLSEWKERQAAAREARLRTPLTPATRRGTYAVTGEFVSLPKSEPYRDPVLLEMAERKPCLLQVNGVCNGRTDTTVACHSNQSIHGKAGARKADDCYSVWGCAACHAWLDQGPAMASHKEAVFRYAHQRQIECWKVMAAGMNPERYRKAAARALDRLNATTETP